MVAHRPPALLPQPSPAGVQPGAEMQTQHQALLICAAAVEQVLKGLLGAEYNKQVQLLPAVMVAQARVCEQG